MATLMGLLNVGGSSLATQQAEMAVAGNNIANAQTPGYNKRTLIINEGLGAATGGSVASAVTREADFVLSQQLAAQQGALSMATGSSTGLTQLENVFSAGQDSLATAVTNLAQSWSQLSASPGDLTLRADVVAKGGVVVQQFQGLSGQLSQLSTANVANAQALIPTINAAATQIATLNRAILEGPPAVVPPEAAGANNLNLDQRDVAAQKLADLAGGQLLRNPNGTYDVLVGNLSLVHGAVSQPLALTTQPSGALTLSIGGQTVQGPVSGQLGGALAAQTATVNAQQAVDQLAFDLTSAMNTQNALGTGLDGVSGRSFFTKLASPSGAAAQVALDPSLNAQTVAAGLSTAAGDNQNAVAMANLIDQPVLNGGKSTFQNVYGGIVSTIGNQVQQAQADQQTAQGHQQALSTQQQSIAGVSTDEEMTNIIGYQRAYEASAQFLKAVDEMLTTLTTATYP